MKHQTIKSTQEKEVFIAEFLKGDYTYRKFGSIYGIDHRTLHSWVTKFRGGSVKKEKPNNLKGNREKIGVLDKKNTLYIFEKSNHSA